MYRMASPPCKKGEGSETRATEKKMELGSREYLEGGGATKSYEYKNKEAAKIKKRSYQERWGPVQRRKRKSGCRRKTKGTSSRTSLALKKKDMKRQLSEKGGIEAAFMRGPTDMRPGGYDKKIGALVHQASKVT